MLPARNQARAGGVALNPKKASDSHDKDKSDRATLEQVLDSRTRLVLTGLVNRDVIGKINRCISTGKEVRGDEMGLI
jgi:RIO kinase 1